MMRAMFWFFLGLLVGNANHAHAQTQALAWGYEVYNGCGVTRDDRVLGDGVHDVLLRSISGNASGAPNIWMSAAPPNANYVRASLTAILATDYLYQDVGGLSRHLARVILKQADILPVHQSVQQTFSPPIRIPRGRLTMIIDTQTYTNMPPPVPVAQCLDTELQLTFVYEAAP